MIPNRIKAACRTNEPQVTSCLMLTGLNLACCLAYGAAWYVWATSLLIYPMIAFAYNLTDPIPEDIGP